MATTNSGAAGSRHRLLLHLDDHLDLDRSIAGKSRHTDRRARMLSDALAEDFDHQIGKPVHHPGLVAETVGRVDHAENLDDALDAIEAAERRAYFSQHDQSALPGGLVACSTVRSLPTFPLSGHWAPGVLPDRNSNFPVCTAFTKLAAGTESGGKVMFSSFSRASAPAAVCAGAEPAMAIKVSIAPPTMLNATLISRLLFSVLVDPL